MRSRHDDAPPSSRAGRRASYRFATMAALVRRERMTAREAGQIVDEWDHFVRAQQRSGLTPSETAAALGEFATRRRRASSRPPRSRRDPSKKRRDPAAIVQRKGAGEERVSARGFKYRVCPRGIRIHTLLFPRDRYTRAAATRWARGHDHPIHEVEETKGFVRIKLNPQRLFAPGSFRTVPLRGVERHGIRAVMGCPRLAAVRGGAARRPGRAPALPSRRPVAA